MDEVLAILPRRIKDELMRLAGNELDTVEEIRIRLRRPIEVALGQTVRFGAEEVTQEDAEQLLGWISQFSFYMLEEQFKRGYITIAGGHRIGLAGKVVLENGAVKGLREISSFNIRIAQQQLGAADQLIPFLYEKRWLSTLLIGPPQTGKTTLLRDIARIASLGIPTKRIPAAKVGIVDERSEIAGSVNGVPQMTLGYRVDVLDGCPKSEGMSMLVRSMSPEVIVTDEIGRVEDVQAVMETVNAGVSLITTVHGETLEDVSKRPIMERILTEANFARVIELGRQPKPGSIRAIYDHAGRKMQFGAGS